MAGLTTNPNNAVDASIASNSNSAIASQLGGGLLLTIPFGGGTVDGCGHLTALQEHRSRLALGAALLEQGLITQEQLQQLAASIAKQIGVPAGGGASAPASPKPSGNRPVGSSASPGAAVQQHFPPLNIGAGATPQRPGRPKPAKGTPPPGRSRRARTDLAVRPAPGDIVADRLFLDQGRHPRGVARIRPSRKGWDREHAEQRSALPPSRAREQGRGAWRRPRQPLAASQALRSAMPSKSSRASARASSR